MIMFDINTFKELALAALPLAGFVTGLTEVVKRTLNLEDRYIPFAAVLIGGAIGWLLVLPTALGVIVGLGLGLSSVGLWEFGKTTVAGISTKSRLED